MTRVRGPRSISVREAVEPLLTASWLPAIDRLVVATFVEMSEGVQSAPWDAVAAEEWFPTEGLERNAQPRGGYKQLIDDVAPGLDIRAGTAVQRGVWRGDGVTAILQDGQRLAVDANGRFDLDTAISYAKALSPYNLFWYEEAGDPLDYELQAALRNYYANPMATGENLFSMQDARNLIRHGGMRADRDWL
eukprot:gene13626-17394_t